jgi:hypothetical protein
VELKEKRTPLHAATVVGDTVGDPFKDTSSVALNPVIKFTTLFGPLAVELAITMPRTWSVALSIRRPNPTDNKTVAPPSKPLSTVPPDLSIL